MKQREVTVAAVAVVRGSQWPWGPDADIALNQ